MKAIKFLTHSVFVLVSILMLSCSGDDGATGATGADGTNGIDGTDGNANVETIIFENPTWQITATYTVMDLSLASISINYENDVIIGYYIDGVLTTSWIPVDSEYCCDNNYLRSYISGSSHKFRIFAHLSDGTYDPTPPTITVKIIVIKGNNTTTIVGNGGKQLNPKQQIKNELKNAEININDYYAVCNYYGVNPE